MGGAGPQSTKVILTNAQSRPAGTAKQPPVLRYPITPLRGSAPGPRRSAGKGDQKTSISRFEKNADAGNGNGLVGKFTTAVAW